MTDTPQFRLDCAELKLEELADERAALIEAQAADRISQLQALSVKQHMERAALTQAINQAHNAAKAELADRIAAAKAQATQARKDMVYAGAQARRAPGPR